MKILKKIVGVFSFIAKTFWNILKFFWGIVRTKVFWIILLVMLWTYGIYWFRSNYHLENPIQIKWKCLVCHNETVKVKLPVPTIVPTSREETSISSYKKYLTDQGAQNREKALVYLSKYYSGDELTAIDNLLKKEEREDINPDEIPI